MSQAKKWETAESADWTVVAHPEVQRIVELVSSRVAAKTRAAILAEDLSQELLLWLAVRPERVKRFCDGEDWGHMYHTLAGIARRLSGSESNRRDRHVSLATWEQEYREAGL